MLSDFGHLLFQLRLENGEKKISEQAKRLGVTTRQINHISEKSHERVDESWFTLVAEGYGMSTDAVIQRLEAIYTDTLPSAPSERQSPAASILMQLCDECGLSLQDISDYTHYPLRFVQYVYSGDQKVPDDFFLKLSETVPMSPELQAKVERLACGVATNALSVDEFTFYQRELLWYISKNISYFSEPAIQALQREINAAKKEEQIYKEQSLPVFVCLHELMSFFNVSKDTIKNVFLNGEERKHSGRRGDAIGNINLERRAFPPQELPHLAAVFSDRVSFLRALQFVNELSKTSFPIPTNAGIRDVEKATLLQGLYEALPYVSTERAESLMSIIWDELIIKMPKKPANITGAAQWGTRPLTPVGEYIELLLHESKSSQTKLSEKTGISLSSITRFVRGERNISPQQFTAIVAGLELGMGMKEMFRYLCFMSVRTIQFDMSSAACDSRFLLHDLRNAFPRLSKSDLQVIADICEKYH